MANVANMMFVETKCLRVHCHPYYLEHLEIFEVLIDSEFFTADNSVL